MIASPPKTMQAIDASEFGLDKLRREGDRVVPTFTQGWISGQPTPEAGSQHSAMPRQRFAHDRPAVLADGTTRDVRPSPTSILDMSLQ